jgi:exodeoxyribonuclease VII large subunit
MINILDRRFPGIVIDVIPVKVQGPGAALEIVTAISWMNELGRADVAILARGGGSLEDLQAFNDESVARAIFKSQVPIVSAVGHETDFTIADFVADLRAPTPSAAAEMIVPIKSQLYEKIYEFKRLILYLLRSKVNNYSTVLRDLSRRLVDPRKKVSDYRLRLDDLCGRLARSQRARFDRCREHLGWSLEKLLINNPIGYIKKIKPLLYHQTRSLQQSALNHLSQRQSRLREYSSALTALSPTAILARGYSMTRALPDGAIVRDAAQVHVGQQVDVRLSAGRLTCDVKEKRSDG